MKTMIVSFRAAYCATAKAAVFTAAAVVLMTVLLPTAVVTAAPLEDLVETLPDYGRPPNTMFSGFLDGTEGCDTVTNGKYCKLHYWLALADGTEMDPKTGEIILTTTAGTTTAESDSNSESSGGSVDVAEKPVILWLNGGPGSSSLIGFLSENGPLLINATGGLMKNPYSWTAQGHLLALEAPVGVGYSYCAAQVEQKKPCYNTDRYTASASAAAVQDFFVNKFPELAALDFFITGESYAGVYIPTLSKEILDHHAAAVPLKGIAVGDPCTDNTAQSDSMDSIWYGHKYGLVDDATFDLLWNHCSARSPNLMTRGGKHLVAAQLNQELLLKRREQQQQQQQPGSSSRLGGANQQEQEQQEELRRLRRYYDEQAEELRQEWESLTSPGPQFSDTPECRMAYRKFLLSSSKGLSQSWSELYIDDYSLFAPVSSKQDEDMATYMSRNDVRTALHVQEAPTNSWPTPAVGFEYQKEYDACNWRKQDITGPSMIEFYKDIIPRLDIAWIYNGDTDPCLSYEGTRTAVKRIGYEELDGGSYRPWFYNKTGTANTCSLLSEKAPKFGPDLLLRDVGAQFGGEVVNYEHGLAFVTVHGSGHMVPEFRPQAAQHMIQKLIQRQHLSPLLPNNATLKSADNTQFKALQDAWTKSAQEAPYVTAN